MRMAPPGRVRYERAMSEQEAQIPAHVELRTIGDEDNTRRGSGTTFFTIWGGTSLSINGAGASADALHELIETGMLESIERIDIGKAAGLETLPETISKLTQVTSFRTAAPALRDGAALYGLTGLERVLLEGASKLELPAGIAALTSLRELTVSSKYVLTLPPDLVELPALRSVKVSKGLQGALDELAPNLPCVLLSKRYGFDNSFGALVLTHPADIAGLARLADAGWLDETESIELHASAGLESLPTSLGRLTKLKKLIIKSPRFNDWPSLYRLKNLEEICIEGKAAGALPEGISQLGKLRVLVVRASGISALPSDLATMTQTEVIRVPGALKDRLAGILTERRMRSVLGRFEDWLNEHDKEFLGKLQPGLTDARITEITAALGIELPPEVRALYRWRNGEPGEDGRFVFFRSFLPLENACRVWEQLRAMNRCDEWAVNGKQPPGTWSEHWFPMFTWSNGFHLCVDLHGTYRGKRGQILEAWLKDEDRNLVASDLGSWLDGFVAALEQGFVVQESSEWNWDGMVTPAHFKRRLKGYPIKKEKSQAP